ncbi:type I restriction enzyme HsdR N-terminal domain-containing protein [Candidatus Electronema sp. PJ]|uniref:type I restriction enzyme HsdR N-terminal domain-containing protein n=1 Tax=Candidatus Electronema sp. PJ TaxID=3401572 RepID=UPI003AA97F88
MQQTGHHFVYGTLNDYLTGVELPDTDDERYRQSLARLLVEEKGFTKEELEPRLTIETWFNRSFVRSVIDLTVSLNGQRRLLLRYGPGSLVTREKPALAAARVLDASCCLPLAVVTNGQDAELLETHKGKVLAVGMTALPDRTQLAELVAQHSPRPPLTGLERERNLRVLNAFDVEACCRAAKCRLP